MEIRNLQTFVKVAQLESVTRAASLLGYNQSTVSVQIQKIESELGVDLFERIGNRLYLTKKGTQFYRDAILILEKLENAIDNVSVPKNNVQGMLKIGCIESLKESIMPELISEYCNLYPEVEIVIVSIHQPDLISSLRYNHIDLFCTFDSPLLSNEWVIESSLRKRVVFIGNKSIKTVSSQDLVNASLLLTEKNESYRLLLENSLGLKDVYITPKIETSSTELILKLVSLGLGITFLPEYCFNLSSYKNNLAVIETDLDDMSLFIQVIKHKDKKNTTAMKKFIDLFNQHSTSI